MGRTKIELLSSGTIDMYDDVSTPLNYAIADIREPEKRDASYSKTIKIPATKNNNKLFTHIFDLNITNSSYNPNRKAECILYIDDVPQIKGFIQLLSIEQDDQKHFVYNCSIRGQVGNIFQALGDLELRDLDLSAYNHTYSKSVQKTSWSNTYTSGYTYRLIDYGYDNNFNSFDVTHFRPATFVRTIIDKIFSNAGYTYESSFFDSTRFKKLIIPATEELKYTESEIADRLFEGSRTTSTQNIPVHSHTAGTVSTYPQVSFNNDVVDPLGDFKHNQGLWKPTYSGYYDLYAECQLNTSGTISGSTSVLGYLGIRRRDILLNQYTLIDTTFCQVSNAAQVFKVDFGNVYCRANDEFDICFYPLNAYAVSTIQLQFATTNSRFYNKLANQLQSGDTVVLSNTLPNKIKCRDFLKDIIKTFNLFVEVDKDDSNRLLIETRDDFYSSGTIVDWSSKLDNSQPLEIVPMGELDFKKFVYTWKEDKDYFNSLYKDRYDEVYGIKEYDVENDFLTSERRLSVMFSPTPMCSELGDDKVLPRIFEKDSNGLVKSKASNIRLLYSGDTLSTNNSWSYTDTVSGTSTETTYPYCGHLDSLTAPTFDLNFGTPQEVFYNTEVYTDGNIYNLYHKKYVDEITDPDSKIVTGFFYLKPTDISQLDFRDLFYFEKQYFRLNKIYDYDPINAKLTKCEFIKVKEGITFTSETNDITYNNENPFPIPKDLNKNFVQGNGNVISWKGRNIIVNGDNNIVHGGTNVTLLNSSGCIVYDGVQNVTVLNSSGTVIDTSNTLYVNGTSVALSDLGQLSTGWSTTTFSASDYEEVATADTWTVDSGDILTNKYKVLGKTMYWALAIDDSTLSGSNLATQLRIKIPNNYTSVGVTYGTAVLASSGSYPVEGGFVYINGQYAYVSGAEFPVITNGQVAVIFNVTFEIE